MLGGLDKHVLGIRFDVFSDLFVGKDWHTSMRIFTIIHLGKPKILFAINNCCIVKRSRISPETKQSLSIGGKPRYPTIKRYAITIIMVNLFKLRKTLSSILNYASHSKATIIHLLVLGLRGKTTFTLAIATRLKCV